MEKADQIVKSVAREFKLSGIVVICVGRQGGDIAEQLEKECGETPCLSFLDENEIVSWEEMPLRGEFMEVIVAGMDDAYDEALVVRLINDAEKHKAVPIVIMGNRGNRYMEIAEKCKAVILCAKDARISDEEQDQKMYAAVRGLVLAKDIESDVFINASDIAAILDGECQFGAGTDKEAVVAAKQAMKGLSGRNYLLCFVVSEGVSLSDIHEAMAKIQEGLDKDMNIIFGIMRKRERRNDISCGQTHTYWRRERLVLTKTPGRIPAYLPDKPVEKIVQVMAYTCK